ncbi:hypothetical protein L218DRAFT_486718 [Marasmius fiardii PR-910]|nr:hypothetical protein L218DRAFT_486718 [Marasmius fiardii PR-910]
MVATSSILFLFVRSHTQFKRSIKILNVFQAVIDLSLAGSFKVSRIYGGKPWSARLGALKVCHSRIMLTAKLQSQYHRFRTGILPDGTNYQAFDQTSPFQSVHPLYCAAASDLGTVVLDYW